MQLDLVAILASLLAGPQVPRLKLRHTSDFTAFV